MLRHNTERHIGDKLYMNKKSVKGFIKWMLIVIFFAGTMLPAVNTIFFKKDAADLAGVAADHAFPTLTKESYLSGEFQSQFDTSFSKGFSGYNAAVRLKNEIRYKCFGEASADIVKCNDDSLIFKSYIDEYLGLGNNQYRAEQKVDLVQSSSYYCSDEYIADVTSQLKTISELAEKNGKQFLVLITPTKAEFIEDSIPQKFKRQTRAYSQEERGVNKLINALQSNDITYVDGGKILRSSEYHFELFPKTGIHWTKEAAYTVLNSALDVLNEKGANLKKLNITGRVTEQAPRTDSMNSDVDLYSLLNIISPYDTEFSYPVVTTDENGQYQTPSVFIQGGSFTFPVSEALSGYNIASDVNFLFYNMSFYDKHNNYTPINSFTDPIISDSVINSDLIIIEVNEQNVFNMGSGFYPELIKILSEQNADVRVKYENVGPVEEYNGVRWRWAYAEPKINISRLSDDLPVELSIWVPYSGYAAQYENIPSEVNVEIYLNGKLYITQSASEDEIFDIQIPADNLLPGQDNVIEISSPYLLNPENGDKAYSVQILYAGGIR